MPAALLVALRSLALICGGHAVALENLMHPSPSRTDKRSPCHSTRSHPQLLDRLTAKGRLLLCRTSSTLSQQARNVGEIQDSIK